MKKLVTDPKETFTEEAGKMCLLVLARPLIVAQFTVFVLLCED